MRQVGGGAVGDAEAGVELFVSACVTFADNVL